MIVVVVAAAAAWLGNMVGKKCTLFWYGSLVQECHLEDEDQMAGLHCCDG